MELYSCFIWSCGALACPLPVPLSEQPSVSCWNWAIFQGQDFHTLAPLPLLTLTCTWYQHKAYIIGLEQFGHCKERLGGFHHAKVFPLEWKNIYIAGNCAGRQKPITSSISRKSTTATVSSCLELCQQSTSAEMRGQQRPTSYPHGITFTAALVHPGVV